jgi:hypothetical protein
MTIGPWDRRQPQGQKILHKSSTEKTTSKSEICKKGSGSSMNKKRACNVREHNKRVEKESGSSVNKKRGGDVRERRSVASEKKASGSRESNELVRMRSRTSASDYLETGLRSKCQPSS